MSSDCPDKRRNNARPAPRRIIGRRAEQARKMQKIDLRGLFSKRSDNSSVNDLSRYRWDYYESKYGLYVPRDHSDLAALQILCGDHSERDVSVLHRSGRLVRPWLTLWQDLRTGLLWGWHLDIVPSSVTAGLAYANGVLNYGAQPFSRPQDDFYSYIYTDRGRDYRSHNWDGKTIAVHRQAMKIEGGLKLLQVERKVGILEELSVSHLLARGRNGKEKPVERVFKDLSVWEENTFAEYCGSNSKERPELWRKLYAQYGDYVKGKREDCPFITFEQYQTAVAERIAEYNEATHEKVSLGGRKIIPLQEYRRTYITRYEIAPETLALLLLKADQRIVQKNGVNCFQRHWFYFHPSLSLLKGTQVEIRYDDKDYSQVWVVLPDGAIVRAELITPTSLLDPNKQVLKVVAEAKATERKTIREYRLISESSLRGETTEDRVAALMEKEEEKKMAEGAQQREATQQASVHRISRLHHHRIRAVSGEGQFAVLDRAWMADDGDEELAEVSALAGSVREFEFDE